MGNPFKKFFASVKKDSDSFDWNNTEEQAVLDAVFFSAYKNRLVIKHRLPGSTSFSIFRVLFINATKDPASKYRANTKTVRHEYGHTLQEEYMGFFSYMKKVAFPSLRGYRKKLSQEEYYAQKWEHDADVLGNVKRWE